MDFGAARLLDSSAPLTQMGEFVGTFSYAAPEQIAGGRVDERTDLYALGILFYRLLSGKAPFKADTPQEWARLHMDTLPPPPTQLFGSGL